MSWSEIRHLWIPELGCNFGEACQRLKRAWSKYKRFHKQGDRAFDWILKVNRIQRALGLEMTDFRDGPGLDWVKDQLDLEDQGGNGTGVELSGEELELKFEQDQEEKEKESWSTWDEDEEETQPTDYLNEDPLYAQLRREEKEEAEEQEYGIWSDWADEDY
jgi:hypothetical protein